MHFWGLIWKHPFHFPSFEITKWVHSNTYQDPLKKNRLNWMPHCSINVCYGSLTTNLLIFPTTQLLKKVKSFPPPRQFLFCAIFLLQQSNYQQLNLLLFNYHSLFNLFSLQHHHHHHHHWLTKYTCVAFGRSFAQLHRCWRK